MKKMHIFVLIVVATLLPALPAFAAGVPTTLSYQGSLTDKAGAGITGNRTLEFRLYSVATGGSSIWNETQSNLTVTNGRFAAVLGQTAALDVSLFTGDTWLGITVSGEPEMTPRQKHYVPSPLDGRGIG